jgi:hypothetical protein
MLDQSSDSAAAESAGGVVYYRKSKIDFHDREVVGSSRAGMRRQMLFASLWLVSWS